jgi:hypothetical protein
MVCITYHLPFTIYKNEHDQVTTDFLRYYTSISNQKYVSNPS